MGVQIVQNTKLWLDGYDLTGRMNAMALDYSANMVEDTVMEDTTHTFLGGLKIVSMSHSGFFSAGAGDIDPVLFGQFALGNTPITMAPTGGADGELAYAINSLLAQYTPGGAIGDMFAFTVSAEAGSDGLVRGTIMHNATQTGSGNGTARQLGALAAGESMFAALHVIEASGTLDVVIQSDVDVGMTSPIDQITFTQATAIGSQWMSKAGAVTDDWWRVSFTIGGGSPSFKFIVMLGIK